ncbi:MAG: His/Gly/Thr/Pro-type tRNA ligase C-terminal domain-containing protein, partial [Candidatus Thermoplasmatota archaeon]|nr:His/Gly/Thr/Pro-type tRNA ligase C-terminal domain-containing protein [Candidatus Thermoplasmatota archaeon]
RGGTDKLEEELSLRPTSESAMYPMFSLWIRTHGDLPLKIFQLVNVYRYETKHTRAFLRDREFHFFEAHTAHATFDEAEEQISQYIDIWKKLAEVMCIPFVLHRRPDWDKFAGAQYSIAAETVMASGRSLQLATFHQYGENFAKPYEITYSDESGESRFVNQTTYGMSTRLIGGIIGTHGDDRGLLIPPDIAPIQAVIVPIPSKRDPVPYANKLKGILESAGIRSRVDSRDQYTPGYKYNDWEMRGVPLRIEIGEREVTGSTATLVMRTAKGRKTVAESELANEVLNCLAQVKQKLTESAAEKFRSMFTTASTLGGIKEARGAASAIWCGSRECADKVEQETEMTCLGNRVDIQEEGNCVVCGSHGKLATFSRTY